MPALRQADNAVIVAAQEVLHAIVYGHTTDRLSDDPFAPLPALARL
jgi:hypothetical protein